MGKGGDDFGNQRAFSQKWSCATSFMMSWLEATLKKGGFRHPEVVLPGNISSAFHEALTQIIAHDMMGVCGLRSWVSGFSAFRLSSALPYANETAFAEKQVEKLGLQLNSPLREMVSRGLTELNCYHCRSRGSRDRVPGACWSCAPWPISHVNWRKGEE